MPFSLSILPGRRARRVSLSCAMIMLAAIANAEPKFLAPYVAFDTERGPWRLVVDDFDTDGRMDIATVNSGWNSVSILLGQGDGTFRDRTEYGVGLVPVDLKVADFDGNGVKDIVVANRDAGTVSVLLGNGDGTFRSKVDWRTGVLKPDALATPDMNADGLADLVVLHSTNNTMTANLGNGDGTFRNRRDYSVTDQPQNLATADLDSDGSPDLAIAIFGHPGPKRLEVWFGRSEGFVPGNALLMPESPGWVQIADLNADGHLDLVTTAGRILALHGTGDGTFGPPTPVSDVVNGARFAMGDLDADGLLDVATVNGTVLRGIGNGLLGNLEQHPTGRLVSSIAIADLNGDGRRDLVASDAIANSVSVLLADEAGALPKSLEAETGVSPIRVVSADFDGDGRPDLATANVVNSDEPVGTVSVSLGIGNGRFTAKTELPGDVIPIALQVGDLNGDPHPDLALAGASAYPDDERPCAFPGKVRLYLGNGDGTFRAGGDLTVACDPVAMAIADLDADGKQDIAVSSYGAAAVSVMLGHGDGTFGTRVDSPGGGGTVIVVGDVNDDGHADLVGPGVMLGNGDGTFRLPLPFGAGLFPHRLAMADLDSDGRLDLAVSRATEAWALLGNGDGSFRALGNISMRRWAGSLAVADLDADGRPDLAVTHDRENLVSVMRGRGDGTFEDESMFGVGDGPASVVAIDADGDRRLDLAVANSISNSVSILLNRGPLPPPTAMSLELTPRTISLASRGRWVNGVLEPAEAAAADIDIATIRLNGTVPVDPATRAKLGDHNGNGVPDLMVKFDRVAFELTLADGEEVAVNVTGTVAGDPFLGSTTARVHRAAVTAPAAGGRVLSGARTGVRWDVPTGTSRRMVELRYSVDGGRSWQAGGAIPNSGSCDWTVPETVAEHARIALVLPASSDRAGESPSQVLGVSATFAIVATLPVGDPPLAPALSLRGATPNPARDGRFLVQFALRDGSAARMDLIDVSGRVVVTRDVGAMGHGAHVLDLQAAETLRPGIYFIRLRQNGQEIRSRAVMMK